MEIVGRKLLGQAIKNHFLFCENVSIHYNISRNVEGSPRIIWDEIKTILGQIGPRT